MCIAAQTDVTAPSHLQRGIPSRRVHTLQEGAPGAGPALRAGQLEQANNLLLPAPGDGGVTGGNSKRQLLPQLTAVSMADYVKGRVRENNQTEYQITRTQRANRMKIEQETHTIIRLIT